MRKIYQLTLLLLMIALGGQLAFGQAGPNYNGGLKVKLSEDGSRYVRFITWHQTWLTTTSLGEDAPDFDVNFLLRRSRFLAYAQINKRFLILTHFGVNSLSPGGMGGLSPLGSQSNRGANGEFFMHDAWTEFTVAPKKLYIGAGLHYWNGVSRLTNQSTLNIMTLDAPLSNWFTIGTSDQFARHLGVYAKGRLGKFDYRVSFNDAINNPILGQSAGLAETGVARYGNIEKAGGGKVVQGYFNYQFLDPEGNTLPYFVGTYVGTKRVFNIGAGFYNHFAATTSFGENGDTTIHDATSLGFDVFYDAPLGQDGSAGALTAYAVLYIHNWGPNLVGALNNTGTGSVFFGQLGYVLPIESDKVKIQPYVAHQTSDLEGWSDLTASTFNQTRGGVNFFLEGHHAKITAEYVSTANAGGAAGAAAPSAVGQVRLQAMIWF